MKKNIPNPQAGDPVSGPPVLSLFEKRLTKEEIARSVDKRTLSELDSQVADAFQQLIVRAHAGDDAALGLYFVIVQKAVMSFDNLVRHEPDRLRAIAEQSPNLPVLLSLNPQDIAAAKERLQFLKVGTKAILPTRPGQRTDRRNIWTRLATYAFDACMKCSQEMPQIEKTVGGTNGQRVEKKLWETIELETRYVLPNGSQLEVADWQRDCAKLGGKITPDNLNQWRDCIKFCVLEFWKRSPDDYNLALKTVGATGELESSRRHLAMNRTLQAFKSQFLQS